MKTWTSSLFHNTSSGKSRLFSLSCSFLLSAQSRSITSTVTQVPDTRVVQITSKGLWITSYVYTLIEVFNTNMDDYLYSHQQQPLMFSLIFCKSRHQNCSSFSPNICTWFLIIINLYASKDSVGSPAEIQTFWNQILIITIWQQIRAIYWFNSKIAFSSVNKNYWLITDY